MNFGFSVSNENFNTGLEIWTTCIKVTTIQANENTSTSEAQHKLWSICMHEYNIQCRQSSTHDRIPWLFPKLLEWNFCPACIQLGRIRRHFAWFSNYPIVHPGQITTNQLKWGCHSELQTCIYNTTMKNKSDPLTPFHRYHKVSIITVTVNDIALQYTTHKNTKLIRVRLL